MGAHQHAPAARWGGGRQLSAPPPLVERLKAAAERFAPGSAQRLVLPGAPAFTCIADRCGALCCRAPYRVDVDAAEAARLAPLAEIEERGAVALLAQSRQGACLLLSEDLRCGAYPLRPRGCVQYPYMLHFIGAEGASAECLALEQLDALVEAWASGAGGEGAAPLLMRDPACPGFVGAPLSEQAWGVLLRSIWQLQRPLRA